MYKTRTKGLIFVIAFGCVLRVMYAFSVPNAFPGWTDSQNYLSIARNVASNFHYANSWNPPDKNHPRFGDIGPTSYREPVYPMLLALQLKIFGESPRAVFVFQALLGTLTIPLCFGIARILLSTRGALLAALLESVNPHHVYYASFISTESVSSIVLLLVVFCSLRTVRSFSEGKCIARTDLGLLVLSLALAVLTRAAFAPVVAATIAFIGAAHYGSCGRSAPAARTIAVLVLLTSACASPWFIRNYFVWHTFVHVTTVGHNLLLGFSDFATGDYESYSVHAPILKIERESYGLNEVERDRLFKQAAIEWIRAHPLSAALLFVKKQLVFWSPAHVTVQGYQKYVGTLWSTILLGLSLIGLVRLWDNSLGFRYILTVIVLYALVHSVALAMTRYRVPLEALLVVFASHGFSFVLSNLTYSKKGIRDSDSG